jgi:hypothetical protein
LKDCKTVALITLSLFISAVFCSAGDSYSQLYNPHGVKILSPTKEQEVPVNIQNLTVEGVSTDNSTNNCDVSLLLNGISPYVKVSSKGQNGPNDFSSWERIFNSNFHLNVGENKLTARLLCSDDGNNQITKYHSVNFTGTNETSSSPITKVLNSPSAREEIAPTNITEIDESESSSSENETSSSPITKVLNSPSAREEIAPTNINEIDESESSSSENETSSSPITKVLNSPSAREEIAPTNITEIDESESSSPELDNQTEVMNKDEVVRNITSGPVIIPPRESQESSTSHLSTVNDSVIIPNATKSDSALDNATSPAVVIPPRESQESSTSHLSTVNDSVIIPNATKSDSALDNATSPAVVIPDNENGSSFSYLPPVNNQSSSQDDQVSKEIVQQPESSNEENDDIPLIFPTPSPRVASDGDSGKSVLNTHVQDSSPVINLSNRTVSEPNIGSIQTNVKIPEPFQSNSSGSPDAPNDISTQSGNQSQTEVVTNSSEKGAENGTSIKTIAGVDQIVNEGMEVILKGDSSSTISSQKLSYEWRQVSGNINVTLGHQNAKQISFQAPEVDKDSKLTFRFIASTDGGQISSDDVNIIINDIPQNLENNESSDSQGRAMNSNNDDNDNN